MMSQVDRINIFQITASVRSLHVSSSNRAFLMSLSTGISAQVSKKSEGGCDFYFVII